MTERILELLLALLSNHMHPRQYDWMAISSTDYLAVIDPYPLAPTLILIVSIIVSIFAIVMVVSADNKSANVDDIDIKH